MHSRQIEVGVLGAADEAAAIDVLARGFGDEPAKLALLPDPRARRVVLEMGVRNRLFDALRYSTVHGARVDGELGAVAVWRPPGVPKLSTRGAVRALLALPGSIAAVPGSLPHIGRTLLMDVSGAVTLLRRRRPAVARASRGPSWCLELLATRPEHRRKGLARAVLERQLRRCDQDAAPAWLETTDPINPPIYERFGFETVAHIDRPAWLPGYWVMRREPRRPSTTTEGRSGHAP